MSAAQLPNSTAGRPLYTKSRVRIFVCGLECQLCDQKSWMKSALKLDE